MKLKITNSVLTSIDGVRAMLLRGPLKGKNFYFENVRVKTASAAFDGIVLITVRCRVVCPLLEIYNQVDATVQLDVGEWRSCSYSNKHQSWVSLSSQHSTFVFCWPKGDNRLAQPELVTTEEPKV